MFQENNPTELAQAIDQLARDLGVSRDGLWRKAKVNKDYWNNRLDGVQLTYRKQIDALVEKLRAVGCTVTEKHVQALYRAIGVSVEPETNTKVTILVEGDVISFTDIEQASFILVLSKIINVSPNQVRILKVTSGSINILLEMPESAASRLLSLYKAGDSAIKALGSRKVIYVETYIKADEDKITQDEWVTKVVSNPTHPKLGQSERLPRSLGEQERQRFEQLLAEAYQLRFELKQRQILSDHPLEQRRLNLDLQQVERQIKELEEQYRGRDWSLTQAPKPPNPEDLRKVPSTRKITGIVALGFLVVSLIIATLIFVFFISDATDPSPGDIQITTPVNKTVISTTAQGSLLEFTYTVTNVGNHRIKFGLALGGRLLVAGKSDWDGENADVPAKDFIELAPGESHIYRGSRLYTKPGRYFVEPGYIIKGGQWVGTTGFRIYFDI